MQQSECFQYQSMSTTTGLKEKHLTSNDDLPPDFYPRKRHHLHVVQLRTGPLVFGSHRRQFISRSRRALAPCIDTVQVVAVCSLFSVHLNPPSGRNDEYAPPFASATVSMLAGLRTTSQLQVSLYMFGSLVLYLGKLITRLQPRLVSSIFSVSTDFSVSDIISFAQYHSKDRSVSNDVTAMLQSCCFSPAVFTLALISQDHPLT